MNSPEPLTELTDVVCYHCGEDVPPGADFSLEIGGVCRPMCCPGCRAVAGLITDSGLERFYAQRTAYNQKPLENDKPDPSRFAVYDEDALADQFCTLDEDGLTDARLLLGGVSCAACTWLVETSLQRLAAVSSATLNLSQSRLDVRFDRQKLSVSELMATIAALGYTVQPWQTSAIQEQIRQEYRSDLRRLAVAGIGMMQVGMFSIALHAGDIQGISADYQFLLRIVSLLVSGFVVVFSARGFFASAWRHLRHGVLVMDFPVALAIGAAFLASAIATLRSVGDVYFDSVVMFTFLLLLARFIEKRLRYKDSLLWQDAEQTLPDATQRWDGNGWQTVVRQDVSAGDLILVRPGDTVPIDGQLRRGQSAVREDSFSGESLPRSIAEGDTVYAGTVNLDSPIEVLASGSYAQSRLAALQQSIDSARHDKPAVARLADRIASRFIGAVLAATLATGLLWWQLDPGRAFWVALAVLVISCPCALSLATPASLASAATLLRRLGIIVHGENALEAVSKTSHVIFDKTGTLTTGAFTLERVEVLDSAFDQEQLLGLAAALQQHSNHPVATAFMHVVPAAEPLNPQSKAGAGVSGSFAHLAPQSRLASLNSVSMGSYRFCRESADTMPPPPGAPLYWVGLCAENQPLAWLGLKDDVRDESAQVVNALAGAGLQVEMLTGDSSVRAQHIGQQLNIETLRTGVSPDQKLERVAALQARGVSVLMVGDGLNDAPVLKRANASVAVAGATDLAKAQADFVIADGDLRQVVSLLAVAARTRHTIVQNFIWALSYNLIGIPLAAAGFVPPWAAALGMSVSSLVVVINASRLRRFRGFTSLHPGRARGIA